MFSVMRCALATERALVNEQSIRRVEMVERLTITTDTILRMATIDGARSVGSMTVWERSPPGKRLTSS